MDVVMVGTGYVGLVSGTCMAEVGHHVTCLDVNREKIAMLREGKSPIYEPGLDALIRRNIEHGRLDFGMDMAAALPKADVVFIAVGTPEGEDGSADLGYVLAVAKDIGRHLTKDMVVVVKSTVPVGTCDKVEETIRAELSARGAKHKVSVVSNPEFLKEGDAIKDFMKPDRVVVGVADHAAEDVLRRLYLPFVTDDPGKLVFMDRRSSELTKYGANAMLATRISFMNELARLCEAVGANVDNVRLGMGSDARIGRKFLYAGPGYGGSCFPKDVAALRKTAEKFGVTLGVLDAVSEANDAQKVLVAEKIRRHFGAAIAQKRVALWGLAFKPGTDDVREAPAKTIVEKLLAWGATVVGHDPQGQANFAKEVGEHPRLTYRDSAYEALEGADALVLLTEWPEYKRPNWEKAAGLMAGRAVFDFRNQYEGDVLTGLGFHYECVGRPDSRTSASRR